jgi:superfamily II DNA/RNA helicase
MGNFSQGRRSSRPSSFGGSSSGRKSYHSGGNRNRSTTKRRFGQTIDPKRFVKSAKPVEQKDYVATHQFSDFAFNDIIKNNLISRNYNYPSQVQDHAIQPALDGKDVIGIANTGTGKTAAFLLPTLNKLMANRGEKVLILAPTRELALQIQEESRAFAKGGRLFDVLLIGGTPMNRQLRDLQRRPEIIIGTPGRVKDHMERGTLKLNDVKTIVLDEVDRMLDMGFINDIREILSNLPKERQSLFFSATLSPTIEALIGTFTDQPTTIMARTSETSDNVEQSIVHYFEKTDKLDKLHDLLNKEDVERTLIFCETKRSTEALSKELVIRGFTSDAMHGNKSQSQRQRALKKFKDGHVTILVATDVAARGIDVDNISHVINYDVPQTYDDYTHRIGRTGRAGTTGNAVTFVTH